MYFSPSVFRSVGSHINAKEVLIRRDPDSGDVILSERPDSWDGFLALLGTNIPEDFLKAESQNGPRRGDPFEDWWE